jgi:hypothetical protein
MMYVVVIGSAETTVLQKRRITADVPQKSVRRIDVPPI